VSHKIYWTERAQKSYIRVADFILKKWSLKEVRNFTDISSSTILKIAKTPEMFISSKSKNVRKGFITKQTSLLYRIKSTSAIELLYFWDNRQNPKKLKD